MMNKSCFCQNPDKVEIFVIKPQNFDAEIRAYFEAFCGENADEAKKTGGLENPPRPVLTLQTNQYGVLVLEYHFSK